MRRFPINNCSSSSPEQSGSHRRESLSANIEDNHLPRFLRSESVNILKIIFYSANFVFPLLSFGLVIQVVKIQPDVGVHSPCSEN